VWSDQKSDYGPASSARSLYSVRTRVWLLPNQRRHSYNELSSIHIVLTAYRLVDQRRGPEKLVAFPQLLAPGSMDDSSISRQDEGLAILAEALISLSIP